MVNRHRLRRRTYTLWQTFKRVIQYRLIVPIKRSNKPPEHTARATCVGLFLAMNPLIGVQMYLCFIVWLISKHFFKKDFSLPIACAWTWVTNVFTMVPVDYLFFVTGKFLMGEHKIYSYGYFMKAFSEKFTDDMTVWQNLVAMFDILVKDWGAAMFIGAVPWMMIVSTFGYFLSYRYALKRHMRKQVILAKSLEKRYEMEFEYAKRKERDAKEKENEFVR